MRYIGSFEIRRDVLAASVISMMLPLRGSGGSIGSAGKNLERDEREK